MEFMNDHNFFLKLELVLSKLISPEFKISDDTVYQKLFDSISQVFSVKECQERMIQLFVPWIISVSITWKDIHINSRVFAFQLISLVCKNENGHYLLKTNNSLSKIVSIFMNDDKNNFSLTVAFIDIISSCNKHCSGRFWVFEMGYWNDILEISLSSRSLYALKKSRNVIAEIILQQMKDNIAACQVILDRIFYLCSSPKDDIHNPTNVLKNVQNQKEFIPNNLQCLKPVMLLREMILHMIDKSISLENISMIGLDKMKDWIWRSIHENNNLMVLSNISKLLCVYNIIYVPHTEDGKINYSDMRILSQKVINHCSILIEKKEFGLVQETCVEYLVLWNRFGKELIYDMEESTTYSFASTPFTILSIPLYMFLRLATIMDSDVMDAFAARVSAGSCIQTKRVCYLYREHFRMHSDIKIQTLAVSVIHCYIRIANISKKEQGVVVFQTLFHIMKKIIPSDYVEFDFQVVADSCTEEQFPQYFPLLSSTLEALHYYISRFDISWRDSLETLCVTQLVQGILNMPNLPPRMYIDALKVTKVILIGYLPVSLALVMDSISGYSVHRLGSQIYKLLHSIQWEVRDSALELLQIVCALAEKKMPAFQPLLLENDLPNVLLSVVQNDSEPYVRASALSCLCYMVRMQSVWNSALENQAFLDKMCSILIHDSEGVVRHKCVLLIRDLYNYQHLSQVNLDKMLDLLCHVTLSDLHWEVKKASILFWDSILEKVLTDEGMVDGEFPDHIFSREKRKIIKLTPAEMSLRVVKVFEILSAYGCLYVLWEVIQHDCDLEVTKEAGRLIIKIIKLMEKFDAFSHLKETNQETESETSICTISKKTIEVIDHVEKDSIQYEGKKQKLTTDEIIEGIVSEGDLNLLAGLLKTNNSVPTTLTLKSKVKLGVKRFFKNVLDFDVNKCELERVEWISKTSDGIISLFDDILLSNHSQHSKTNVIDCY